MTNRDYDFKICPKPDANAIFSLSFDKGSYIRRRLATPRDETGTTNGDVRAFAFTITRTDGG